MRLRRPTERRGDCAAARRGAATAPGRARPAAARPAPWVPPRRAPPCAGTQPAPRGGPRRGGTPWSGAWGSLCSLPAVVSTREADEGRREMPRVLLPPLGCRFSSTQR